MTASSIGFPLLLAWAACISLLFATTSWAPTGRLQSDPVIEAPSLLTPLLFHSAPGQVYAARSPQFSVQVHGAGFALARPGRADVLTVDLVGASPSAQPLGEQRHGAAVVNHFRGSDASQWRSGVPVWERVRVANTYDGVDVVYYTAASGQLEFDFALQPGADPSRIGMRFATGWSLSVDASLTATHPDWGALTLPKPVIYQPLADSTAPVDGGYTLIDNNVVGFWLGDYDATLPLVIDPLVFSTYLGGSGFDFGYGIAVDSAGNIAVTGYTTSADFPTTDGSSFSGSYDGFVCKFDASGALVFSTYLGGSDTDFGHAIAVDSAGNIVVTGQTYSEDFPTTPDAHDASFGGVYDAFVSKFSATGALLYSTFVGGSNFTIGHAIAVDSAGNVVVTGETESGDFPTTPDAHDASFGGVYDGFVSKFSATGALVFSTYLGGSGKDRGHAIAVDSAGNVVVTGATDSSDFPTTPGAFDASFSGTLHAFVSKFDATGALVFSTFLGGSNFTIGHAVAVDSAGNVVVAGETESSDFPTTPGAFDTSLDGVYDAFVSKFSASGALLYSTFVGGQGEDFGYSVAIDSAGNIVVTGETESGDFPTTPDAHDASFGGIYDAFVSKFSATGALLYSTYVGGSDYDRAQGVAIDSAGNIAIVGATLSSDFPKTSGGTPLEGSTHMFVTKLFECSTLNAHGFCGAGCSHSLGKARDANRKSSPDRNDCSAQTSKSFASFHRRRRTWEK